MDIFTDERLVGTDGSGIPTITLKDLKKTLAEIPDYFDECPVVFAYIHEDLGENFMLGTIAIKFPIVHPDKNYVCLLDGNAGKKFYDWYKSGKVKGKIIEEEKENNDNRPDKED